MLYKWLPETWKEKTEHREMKKKINAARKAAGLKPVNYSTKSVPKTLIRILICSVVIISLILAVVKLPPFNEACNKFFSQITRDNVEQNTENSPAFEFSQPKQNNSMSISSQNTKKITYNSGAHNYKSFSGRIHVESFTITKVESSSLNTDLIITYEIIGTVFGSDYLSLNLKCYDAEGFLIDSALILDSASNGERFKLTNNVLIPAETAKVELSNN